MSVEAGEEATALPHLEYVMIANGAHSIHRNEYQAFWDVLSGWLDRVRTG